MANKAIHQLPGTNQRLAGDLFHLVTDLGGGTWADRKIDEALLPRGIQNATYTLTSAEVLALNSTPVAILGGQGTGTFILPMFAVLRLENATADYTTNVNVIISPTSDIGVNSYCLSGVLPLMATPTVQMNTNFINNQRAAVEDGGGLSIAVLTGDPAAGDGDIVVTVYYRVY